MTLIGSLNPNWRGGKTISSHGYILIKIPELKNRNGANAYKYEHRIVAEKILGRPLLKGEIVHHKDGNKLNNSEENIQLCASISYHKLHHRKKTNLQLPDETNYEIFCSCGCGKKLLKYDFLGRPRKYAFGCNSQKGKGKINSKETILCACGCNSVIPKYDKYGRSHKFITGHNGRILCKKHV